LENFSPPCLDFSTKLPDAAEREDTQPYPIFALREAIQNEFVYRDYSAPDGDIWVHFFHF